MSALSSILGERIRRGGPITVAEYMELALTHPEHGYYMKQDPFGQGGDFTTAPEISQMFGEVLGMWSAVVWQAAGAPSAFNLVELGPGRGTLMADVLRATAGVPGFHRALTLHLVEISPVLKRRQGEGLAKTGLTPHWHDTFDTVPGGPLLLLANEFFDALPVRQFVRGAQGWSERTVELEATAAPGEETTEEMPEETGFQFGLTPPEALAQAARPLVPPDLADSPVGSVFEACPAATGLAHALGERIARDGMAALIVDYGHFDSAAGETLQAVKGHGFHDLLADPGDADLTAHVDFGALARAAAQAGADVRGPVPQGAFLERLGLGARAQSLLAGASPEQAEDIRAAHQRLIGGEAMGLLFKAMVIARPGLAIPPWS